MFVNNTDLKCKTYVDSIIPQWIDISVMEYFCNFVYLFGHSVPLVKNPACVKWLVLSFHFFSITFEFYNTTFHTGIKYSVIDII